jgi:hypothetical protein
MIKIKHFVEQARQHGVLGSAAFHQRESVGGVNEDMKRARGLLGESLVQTMRAASGGQMQSRAAMSRSGLLGRIQGKAGCSSRHSPPFAQRLGCLVQSQPHGPCRASQAPKQALSEQSKNREQRNDHQNSRRIFSTAERI